LGKLQSVINDEDFKLRAATSLLITVIPAFVSELNPDDPLLRATYVTGPTVGGFVQAGLTAKARGNEVWHDPKFTGPLTSCATLGTAGTIAAFATDNPDLRSAIDLVSSAGTGDVALSVLFIAALAAAINKIKAHELRARARKFENVLNGNDTNDFGRKKAGTVFNFADAFAYGSF
jgi:hypothetical protein